MIEKIAESVVENLTEGIIVVSIGGTIIFSNEAASSILAIDRDDMLGHTFADVFFEYTTNDEFAQVILDAIHSKNETYISLVSYFDGEKEKHLRVAASYLKNDHSPLSGFTIIISDLSGINELQDAVKAMERINDLNRQLEDRNDLLNRTFGMFLSDDIVSHLLDSPDGLALGGEKQVLTIMMSDLRGFTSISERMDPGEMIKMLNHYLAVMTDVIQKRGGTIIEFIGDGILAVFGAPNTSKTHAEDAIAAALEMQLAMEGINRWNTENNMPHLEMGIGLDTGEVIIGNIGSEKRMKYGVVGSHVNLCGRIESYTVGGQILISPSTREAVSAPLQIARELYVQPKGVDGQIALAHVTGIGEPYDLHISSQNDTLHVLKNPIPIYFFKMDEKHTLNKPYYGGIVSIGRDSAILETETNLQLFDNIQMNVDERLQCKVIKKDENSYLLQYTFIPFGYERWMEKIIAEEK